MNINDYLKISNSQWGRYRVKGYTKVNASKDIVSLLGKHNTPATLTTNVNFIATTNGSFATNIANAKKINVVNNHYYLCIANVEDATELTQTMPCWIKGYNSWFYNHDRTIYLPSDNKWALCKFNSMEDSAGEQMVGMWFQQNAPHTANALIIIDLTELGLDNLTAQEFYNQYNQFFDKLANGETIPAIMNAVSPFNFYKDNELVATYSHPLTLRQGDTFTNTNGKNNVVMGAKKLIELNINYYNGVFYSQDLKTLVELVGQAVVANALCSIYKPVSYSVLDSQKPDKTFAFTPSGNLNIIDNSFTRVQDLKNHFTGNDIIIYPLATPQTNTLPSQMIKSGVTSITDANGVELEFEILNDNLNFSNRTLVGKATPTITAEKIISKGFTSAGTHYAQMYIYDDGEVWYVNNGNHATAYANGVWEIEYKTIKFDSGVVLTQEEKETLLKIFN